MEDALLTSLLLAAAMATPVTYEVTPDDSRLYVLVRYDRSTLLPGHDHVVAATDYKATVIWDPEDLASCAISYVLDVRNLAVEPGDARSWEELEGSTPERSKPKIQENFWSETQLNASSFAQITFESTRCEARGAVVDVTGTFAMRGVSREVTIPMTIEATPEGFSASGSTTLLGSRWGLEPYTAALGALRNDDALKLGVVAVGRPVP